jgi:hypothetical protein
MDNAYALPIDAVLANFKVEEHNGLTDNQVTELRNKHGRNGAQSPSPGASESPRHIRADGLGLDLICIMLTWA